jgi:hypothetical protein
MELQQRSILFADTFQLDRWGFFCVESPLVKDTVRYQVRLLRTGVDGQTMSVPQQFWDAPPKAKQLS